MQPVDPVTLTPIERRERSVVGSTDSIPAGTMVCVPSAPTTGPVPVAPIVAATVQPAARSWTLYILAAEPFVDALAEQIVILLQWNPKYHRISICLINCWLAFRHVWKNTVTTMPKWLARFVK